MFVTKNIEKGFSKSQHQFIKKISRKGSKQKKVFCGILGVFATLREEFFRL